MTAKTRTAYRFDHAFIQAGIKYYVWYSRLPVPGDSRYEEIVYKADYFWGLM